MVQKEEEEAADMGKEVYFAGTVLSILISLALYLSGKREAGIFVGMWAPTIMLLEGRMSNEDRSPARRGVWRRGA